MLLAFLVSLWLTVQAAKEYRFERRALLRTSLVHALTLAIGVLAIVLDDLLGARAR